MGKPHKHAELIKAWADGAEIQYRADSNWYDCTSNSPMWDETQEYRIKPEPKPDVVLFVVYEWNPINERTYSSVPNQNQGQFSNLKLTFDGETGKLKSAEVL
jgi:hypothetical protein